MKRTNTITAVLFLAVLAGMLALTCLGLPEVKAQLAAGWAGQAEDADRSLPAKAGYVLALPLLMAALEQPDDADTEAASREPPRPVAATEDPQGSIKEAAEDVPC